MTLIDKVALILLSNGSLDQSLPRNQLLVARSEGKELFYIPGGKRESGETDHQTLIREIQEELGVSIVEESIQYANTFEAPADGKLNTLVRTTCYFAQVFDTPHASQEIEELKWISLDDRHECSLVTQMILDWLHANDSLHCRVYQPSVNLGAMQSYQWIVFDADNTLFRFKDFEGLQLMLKKHWAIDLTDKDYAEYKTLNTQLWRDYEAHLITSEDLANKRFESWAIKLNTTPDIINQYFLSAMAEVCTPLPGADQLIKTLHRHSKLAIITNGFTSLQNIRLEKNELLPYFEFVLTSEAVGVAKPHKDIFTQALLQMGSPSPDKVLMVGDNPSSDIKGGKNAGFITCLLDESNRPQSEDPACIPDYTVSSLAQLLSAFQRSSSQSQFHGFTWASNAAEKAPDNVSAASGSVSP